MTNAHDTASRCTLARPAPAPLAPCTCAAGQPPCAACDPLGVHGVAVFTGVLTWTAEPDDGGEWASGS